MDVMFQPSGGSPFYMEVGYFDTVLEIKEKIQKHQGIPISQQTLIFNGNILQDDLNVHNSDILDRSRIDLLLPSDDAGTHPDELELSPSKIQLLLKLPSKLRVALEMDVNETIRRLKEKIQEMERVPIDQLAVHANGIELHDDDKSMQDCELSDNSEIHVAVRSSPVTCTTSRSSSGKMNIESRKLRSELSDNSKIDVAVRSSPVTTTPRSSSGNMNIESRKLRSELSDNSKIDVAVRSSPVTTTSRSSSENMNIESRKLRIFVLNHGGTEKISVEVNSSENVMELRKKLRKLKMDVPKEGYFFIYKQDVMDDDRSFRWHNVCQGDTIEVFRGRVTRG